MRTAEGSRAAEQRNCMYAISCKTYKKKESSATYMGEMSCTLYLRGKEHKDALESQSEDSTLWLHCIQQHDSTMAEFEINLIKRHLTDFKRQVHEGVLIMLSKSEHPMNRQYEFNGSNMP